jgi:ribosome-associated protein
MGKTFKTDNMELKLSKSERKRRAKDVEKLVYELVSLPHSEIKALPCDQEIMDEILSAKNRKGGAQKRQLKYATKLLRKKPIDDLYDFLEKKKGSSLQKNREFHNLEHLRDLLINEALQQFEDMMQNNRYINEDDPLDILGKSDALAAIAEQLPKVDQTLLKNAAIQFARTRNKKFSRELFRVLKAEFEKEQYLQKNG